MKSRDPHFDMNVDYNKIFEQIQINYIFKVFRLATIIFLCSYFLGVFQYIFFEIEYKE